MQRLKQDCTFLGCVLWMMVCGTLANSPACMWTTTPGSLQPSGVNVLPTGPSSLAPMDAASPPCCLVGGESSAFYPRSFSPMHGMITCGILRAVLGPSS